MRSPVLAAVAVMLSVGRVHAQADSPPDTTESTAVDVGDAWAFSASAFFYFVPDDKDFLMPVVTADRGRLHLEARYNYEDLDTGSGWIGCILGGGDELAWAFTPMLGAVFGSTNGIGPGYNGSLGWRKFELYSEGEYVFDTGDSSDSFFYTWSEWTCAPADAFWFGLVIQRTRAYGDRDVQPGVVVGFAREALALAVYVFNPDEDEPVVALALSAGW